MSISTIKPDYDNTEDSRFEESNFRISSSTTDEVNSLMRLAEDIKNKCDIYVDEIENIELRKNIVLMSLFILQIMGYLTFFILNYSPNFNDQEKKIIYAMLFIVFLATVLIMLIIFMNTGARVNKLKRKIRYEEKILIEIVGLLREIGGVIANKEGWDEFKRIAFKIRLSRYEIGKYKV